MGAIMPESRTDLRAWLDAAQGLNELQHLHGADWNKEIGTVVELNAKARGPALLFDKIKGYPAGFRLLAGAMSSAKRLSLTLGMPLGVEGLDLIRSMKDKMRGWSDELDEFPLCRSRTERSFKTSMKGSASTCSSSPHRCGTTMMAGATSAPARWRSCASATATGSISAPTG